MLTLLYRTEYRHQWGSKTYYNRIGLDHLGTASSTELVKAMLEEGEVAPELRELILERSAGNPLFMEEFTQSLIDNGSIEKRDKQYVLSRDVSDIQVPDTIQGIIAARMDRLEENLKRTMQVASVIGRDFAFRILQNITNMKEELKIYLLNLQGLEFIYEKQLFPELEYIFKHALTQEVAYNSLLLKRRKEIHEEIGKAIEELYPERREEFYEMLTYHFLRADSWEKCAEYAKLSAQKAMVIYSLIDAISFVEQRINSLEQLPDTNKNRLKIIDTRIDCSEYCIRAGFAAKAKEVIEPVVDYIDELNNKQHLPMKYLVFGCYEFQVTEDFTKGKHYLEKTILITGDTQEGYVGFIAPYFLGIYLSMNGKFSEGFAYHRKLLELLQSGEYQRIMPWMKAVMALTDYLTNGKIDIAMQLSSEALKEAINLENIPEHLMGVIQFSYAASLYYRGQLVEAEKELLACLEILKRYTPHSYTGWACMFLGFLYDETEDYTNSKFYFYEATNLLEKSNFMPSMINFSKCASIKEQFYIDNKYTSILEKMIYFYRKIKYSYIRGLGANLIGEVILRADEFKLDDPEKWIFTAIEINRQNGFNFSLGKDYALYAELFKRKGDQLKATENLNKAIEILKECGADGWVEKYEKELAAIS
jgi:hypothetical protein